MIFNPRNEDWIQIILVLVFILSRYWFKSIIRIPRPPKKYIFPSFQKYFGRMLFSFFGPIFKKIIKIGSNLAANERLFSAFFGAKKCRFCERFPNYSVYFSSEKCIKSADLRHPKIKDSGRRMRPPKIRKYVKYEVPNEVRPPKIKTLVFSF